MYLLLVNELNIVVCLVTVFSDIKSVFNLLKTGRRPLHLKPQSVPRCKHFSYRL
jgi:hypothetical protein